MDFFENNYSNIEELYNNYMLAAQEKNRLIILGIEPLEAYYEACKKYPSSISATEYNNSMHIFANEYITFIANNKLNYELIYTKDLKKAIQEKNVIKIELLFYVAYNNEFTQNVNDVLLTLCDLLRDCCNNITHNQKYPMGNNYILSERVMDILNDYPSEILLPTLEMVCHLNNEFDHNFPPVFITKSFGVLANIGTVKAFEIVKSCLTHPNTGIREEAQETYDWFVKEYPNYL